MRKLCVFVFLVVTLQYCISCQKQLSFDGLPDNAGDSVTLVKTIKTINYDANDVFYWQTQETYNYNKDLNVTVVDHLDSSEHVAGQVEMYVEKFQYDSQNRLVQFTSTSKYEPDPRIDFSYNSAGEISKVVIVDSWLGKTIECNFTVTMQNGFKTITEYDTSGAYNAQGDQRPEITKSVFDADSRLIKQSLFSTYYRQTGGYFKDTLVTNLFYDNNNTIYKTKNYFVYYPSPPDFLTGVPSNDSTVYTRAGSNKVLMNSFLNVYRNMYWFSISESSGFATSMINSGNLLTYFGPPISTAEFWHFDSEPSNDVHNSGAFQNEFDANGLLTKSVFPKNFANKYGGKAEMWFTYAKVKK